MGKELSVAKEKLRNAEEELKSSKEIAERLTASNGDLLKENEYLKPLAERAAALQVKIDEITVNNRALNALLDNEQTVNKAHAKLIQDGALVPLAILNKERENTRKAVKESDENRKKFNRAQQIVDDFNKRIARGTLIRTIDALCYIDTIQTFKYRIKRLFGKTTQSLQEYCVSITKT